MADQLTNELILKLRVEERRLKRRYGIRVAIHKISANGVNLLCNAWRTGTPLFQRQMEEHEAVALVHHAMRPLYVLGIRPLVSVVSKHSMSGIGKLEKTNPFRLRSAMDAAGISELKPTSESIPSDETERRIALLKAGTVQVR